MRTITKKLQTPNSVGAGQVANLALPAGGTTYDALYLEYKTGAGATLAADATMKSDLLKVELLVNGEILWSLTGADILMLCDFYQIPRVNGYLPLKFTRPWLLDSASEERFALGTLGLDNVTLEVTIASSATSPRLAVYGEIMVGQKRPLGQFVKLTAHSFGGQVAAGTYELHDLPVKGQKGLSAIHIGTDKIANIELQRDYLNSGEGPKALTQLIQNHSAYRTGGRTWQAGWYHLDLAGNRYAGIHDMNVQDFRLVMEPTEQLANFRVITEQVLGSRDI